MLERLTTGVVPSEKNGPNVLDYSKSTLLSWCNISFLGDKKAWLENDE